MSQYTREYKGNSLIEFLDNYVVVDIETTGFSPVANEIIEIGALKVVNNEVIDEFNVLIKIESKIPDNIVRLTGITDELLNDSGIDAREAIILFDKFVCDSVLVGHNVNFDVNFLYDYFERYIKKQLTNDFIDTQRIAKGLIKDTYNHQLKTLARKFDIQNTNAHRSLNDVYVTNELYKKLRHYSEHYTEIRMKEIAPLLIMDDLLMNKKISFKTKLKFLDNSVIEAVLTKLNSKPYFFLAKYADILVVNDNTYEKLQKPLDENDQYMRFFNGWMFNAQNRMKENNLIVISESDFCNKLGIPTTFKIDKELDEKNILYGKTCVFTGTLERMSRKQAETIVTSIGGIIGKGVTKKTNYLILGNNDYNAAVKNGKSSKHKKAEELQAKGSEIEIIPEDIFYELIGEGQ